MNFQKNLYKKFIEKDLPLGDQLAAARSILANERTFLSYQRTAITLFVTGISFVQFFDIEWITFIGWIFIPASFTTMLLGVLRYVRMRDLIRNLEHETYICNDENNEKSS
jgi:putative membrane protein